MGHRYGDGAAVRTGGGRDPGRIAFVTGFEAPRDGRLFGPVVPVPGEATELDRLLGLTGHDPRRRPPA